MCAAVSAAPPAEKIDGITNQVMIQIAVSGGKLHVYPQRGMDAQIYHVSDEDRRKGNYSPAKPWAVRWVATGLVSGQKIVITPKETNRNKDLLDLEYVIEAPNNTIHSCHATRSPGGKPSEMRWDYGIVLWEGTKELDRIDPGIIVKDDP